MLLGNGMGDLKPLARYDSGVNPHGLTSEDFNQDGELDLAVSNRTSGGIAIFLGDGSGTFQKTHSVITEHDGITLSHGDFDKDGIIDLALVSASSHSLIFYKGDGKGNFHPW